MEIVTNDSVTIPLAASEEVRIGVIEGGPAYQLHDVADVDVGQGGTIVAFNEGSLSLRLFDRRGRFLRELGREGEGPGEFRGGRTAQYSVGIWGDTIVVSEAQGSSVSLTVFDTAGALLHTARRGQSVFFFRDETVVPAGPGVLRFTNSRMPATGWDVEGEAKGTELVVREIDLASGEMGPELARVPGRLVLSIGEGVPYPRWLPYFEPSPVAALVPGGILTSGTADYEIRLLDPDGTPRRVVRRRHRPRPLEDDVSERLDAALADAGRTRTPMSERIRERIPQVSVLPPLDRLVATREGGFWVRRKDLTADPVADMIRTGLAFDGIDPVPAVWDGFGRDGVYLGTVELPEGFEPHAWGRDWVAGVLMDELQVEYVVKLALRPAG